MAHDEPEEYLLDEPAREAVENAIRLLGKVLASNLGSAEQREAVAELAHVFACVPRCLPPRRLSVSLRAPTRQFDERSIWHYWQIEVDNQELHITGGGYLRPHGDSFTLMQFFAAPDAEASLDDWSYRFPIIDDAMPFGDQVAEMDLSEPGYTLTVLRDGDTVPADEEDDAESE